jgi:hypothetical protein
VTSEELPDDWPEVPDGVPDERRVYRKTEDGKWDEIELRDVQPEELIAIVDDSSLTPNDVQLWIAAGDPFQNDQGLWMVNVVPASEARKRPASKD